MQSLRTYLRSVNTGTIRGVRLTSQTPLEPEIGWMRRKVSAVTSYHHMFGIHASYIHFKFKANDRRAGINPG